MQEPWVRSLGREDALEEGLATLSSMLAWSIPWTEAIPVHGVRQESDWATKRSTRWVLDPKREETMNLGPGPDKIPWNASHAVRQALRPPPARPGCWESSNSLWFKAPGLQLTQILMLLSLNWELAWRMENNSCKTAWKGVYTCCLKPSVSFGLEIPKAPLD